MTKNSLQVPEHFYRQSGVIAYQQNPQLQILLITSSSGRRWVIPKGVVEPDLTPWDSAAKEAEEEAGVRGRIYTSSIGTYQYSKWAGTCVVEVFPLLVETVLEHWPESHRKRRWFKLQAAAKRVSESELQQILLAFVPPP